MTLVEKKSRGAQFVAYALIGIMLASLGYGVGVWSAPVTSFGIDGSGNLNVNQVATNNVLLGSVDVTKAITEETASYVVWVDGGVYYAKNGHTGAVTNLGANAGTAVQTISDLATLGTVIVKCGITSSTTITLRTDYQTIIFQQPIQYDGTGSAIVIDGYAINLEFSNLNGKIGNASACGIQLKYGVACNVIGNQIGSTDYSFTRSIWFDQSTSTGVWVDNDIKINLIYGGDYGIDVEPGANGVEGNTFTIGVIQNPAVLMIRIGASGGANSVLYNKFVCSLDAGITTPKLFECYCNRNMLDFTTGYTAPTGAVKGQFYPGTEYNTLLISDIPTLTLDQGTNNRIISPFPVKNIVYPTAAGWSTSNVNGAVTPQVSRIYMSTSVTASSRAMAYISLFDLNSGDIASYLTDWSKRIELSFTITRATADTEVIARVQLKQANTEGILADKGIGVQISNYVMIGESYGAARGTTGTLKTLTTIQNAHVKIVVTSAEVEFWVNGVLIESLTGNAIPTGLGGADGYLVISIVNGGTGGADAQLWVSNIQITQDWS
jgi:hypothetical protein